MQWNQFNLQSWITERLNELHLKEPTKIQSLVINEQQKQQNLIVSSPTGSGKTYAFLLPILNQINSNLNEVQAVIICPTRELAQQIYQVTKEFVINQPIKVGLFIGGISIEQQVAKINQHQPQIVIGTISRVKILYEKNYLKITTAKTLVIDECDMIFELGINQELAFILSKMHSQVQKLAFSATIDQKLTQFLKKYWQHSQQIILKNEQAPPKVNHHFINCQSDQTQSQLIALTKLINPFIALVFVNHHSEVLAITELLTEAGFPTGALHSQLTARQRRQVFKNINLHHYQYLVCTDVAARGIDVAEITDVISLKLPSDLKYYLHRAGRTGRQTATGNSYVFYEILTAKQQTELKVLAIRPKFYKIKQQLLVPITQVGTKQTATKSTRSQPAIAAINQFHHPKAVVKPGYKKAFKTKMAQIGKIEKRTAKRKTKQKSQR